VALLAGVLPECRNTLNAKHLPKAVEGSGPLIYRNTEPSLVGDDVADTISGGAHNNDTADQTIFNPQQAH
jgi:hypothetical protein